jgi:integrase
MGRRSSVRYFASKGAYFTNFEGQRYRLADGPDDAPKGPTYLAALRKFGELMSVETANSADQANTVRVVVDLYGQHLERNGQDRSLEIVLQTCTSAIAEFGDKTFAELKPIHVTNWLAKMAKPRDHTHKTKVGGQAKTRRVKWGPTYQNMALRTLVAAFNWAKGQGLITAHCLQNPKAVVVRGRKRSRGAEVYVSPATWKKLIDRIGATNHAFADLLRFVRGTGCRPSEAYHVEARYYRKAERCIVYPGHPAADEFAWKNARKSGKDRVIFLSAELVEIVERRIAEHPEGAIFRSRHKARWSQEAVSVNLRWYAKRLGISPAPNLYGLRHSYATDWLLAGGSIKVLADLIGTSVSMLERHYAHLMVDKARMHSIMEAVMKDRDSVTAEEPKAAAAGR